MDYLGDNRYQLLFVDDDANDQSVDQKQLPQMPQMPQMPQAVAQPKTKRTKTPRDKAKSIVEMAKMLELQSKSNTNTKLEMGQVKEPQQLKEQAALEEEEQEEQAAMELMLVLAMAEEEAAAAAEELQQQEQPQLAEEEDDTKYITVEQWRAMHGVRAKPIYNIRKPGEGEPNKPDWKKMTVLQKKKQQQANKSEDDNNLEYDATMYPQRVGRLQRIMDIEFKFKDDRRRSGYLSGWSGRAYNKSESEGTAESINMADEMEFPTLG
ncbi:uncharacterized protein LOC117785327 [Drosophila innubila]|uniref:uncharacterized protein LOC117785327 n=1 Tax=Drosophila innubila TaxID=198719 RepID=UPI00148B3EB8|nr:uncharacterized protein LOC117785327 [Drosophila innubila]